MQKKTYNFYIKCDTVCIDKLKHGLEHFWCDVR